MCSCNNIAVLFILQIFCATVIGATVLNEDICIKDASTSNESETLAATKSSLFTYLQQSSIIFGLTSLDDEHLNPSCAEQLQQLRLGVCQRQTWAMKMLDASGTKPAGYMLGHNLWLGDRQTCDAVQNTVDVVISKRIKYDWNVGVLTEKAPFDVRYRVVCLQHNSTWQANLPYFYFTPLIHVGLCLPSACTVQDIERLMRHYTAAALPLPAESAVYDMHMQLVHVKDLQPDWSSFSKPIFIITIILLLSTIVLMLCAALQRKKHTVSDAVQVDDERMQNSDLAKKPTADVDAADIAIVICKTEKPTRDKPQRFIECFDIKSNWQQLFALHANTPQAIPAINTIRTLSALVVAFVHLIVFFIWLVPNRMQTFMYFDVIKNLVFSVDIFFTISGFLRIYNFIAANKLDLVRKSSFKANVKEIISLIFHRYIRLMPMNLMLMCIVSSGFKFGNSITPLHVGYDIEKLCTNYWWRNVLLIQNFFDYEDMCLVWTWSVACEMQYFVLFTILLFIYAKYPNVAKFLVILLLVANTVWTFYISQKLNFQLTLDSFVVNFTQIYISPSVRILPYIVGALAAWLCTEYRKKLYTSERVANLLWLSTVIAAAAIFSIRLKGEQPIFLATFLYFGARLFIALCVCWVFVSSITRAGAWWLWWTEAKVFQHFSRITYAVSLVNPIVYCGYVVLTSGLQHVDAFALGIMFIGFAFVIYVISVVCSLLFELPYCNLSSWMLRRAKAKAGN